MQALGPDILPLEYGGQAAEIPIEVAVQQLPAWRQRQHATQQAQKGDAAATAGASAGERKAAATGEGAGEASAAAAEVAGPPQLHTASMRLSESSSNLLAVPV